MYMGDSDEVSINVTVTNSADEAFGAKLYVYIPESFELSSFKSIRAVCSTLIPCLHKFRFRLNHVANRKYQIDDF